MLKVKVYEGGESEPRKDWRGRFIEFTFFERFRISIVVVKLVNDYTGDEI
jgi:hypothetical protein